MNLTRSTASTSSRSRHSALSPAASERLKLLGLGLALAGVHQAADLSLGLPGHFGLLWMGVIIAARAGASARYAAVTTAIAYATGGAVFTGFAAHAIAHAPAYLVVALIVDGLWQLSPACIRRPVLAGITGALAFGVKPLMFGAFAAVFEWQFGSLRHGFAFPLLTHACFGATGAVLGALTWQAANRHRLAS